MHTQKAVILKKLAPQTVAARLTGPKHSGFSETATKNSPVLTIFCRQLPVVSSSRRPARMDLMYNKDWF